MSEFRSSDAGRGSLVDHEIKEALESVGIDPATATEKARPS